MDETLYGSSALIAALDAKDFMHRHGESLSKLLHGIAGNPGLDLYCAADRLLDSFNPDPVRVGRTLRDMRELLADAQMLEDRYVASMRWHGARLSDLAAALPG